MRRFYALGVLISGCADDGDQPGAPPTVGEKGTAGANAFAAGKAKPGGEVWVGGLSST